MTYTRWASEGGSFSGGLEEQYDAVGLDQFRVGLEARLWPADNPQTLTDIRFGVDVCGFSLFVDCLKPDILFTSPMSRLKTGKASWSHTANIATGNSPLTFAEVKLTATLK